MKSVGQANGCTHERVTEPMHGFGNYVDMNYVTLRKISRQKFTFLMQLNTNRLNHKLLDFANCLHSECVWNAEKFLQHYSQ